MPIIMRDGVRLYWREDGRREAPPLLLLNSLGTDHTMWNGVVSALGDAFRVLRMDTRGHGASDAPAGDYSIAMLAEDALAVLDAAGVAQAHVCGLSMGGMTVLKLAETAPGRLLRAVVCNSSGQVPAEPWLQRAALVRDKGVGAIADAIMVRFFSPGYRAKNPPEFEAARTGFLGLSSQGYAACCVAIGHLDVWDGLPGITTPVLVVNGSLDEATPPAQHGERIAAAVPGARSVALAAGHVSAIELPAALAGVVRGFLLDATGLEAARDALTEAGLVPRRAVLGAAHVERSMAGATAFTAEFQAMITRTAWGEVWTRPGLDFRTRRLLVLAITVALGRWEEFRLHVRAGLEGGGLSVDELKETLMQCAVYAGVPAANTGFHHANELLKELDQK